MLALATNFIVFYLAAVIFERTGILCAVTVFLVTALAGTIITSMIEKSLWTLLFRGLNAHGSNRDARSSVTTSLP